MLVLLPALGLLGLMPGCAGPGPTPFPAAAVAPPRAAQPCRAAAVAPPRAAQPCRAAAVAPPRATPWGNSGADIEFRAHSPEKPDSQADSVSPAPGGARPAAPAAPDAGFSARTAGSAAGAADVRHHDTDAVRAAAVRDHDTDDVGAADVGYHDTDAVRAAEVRHHDTDAVRAADVRHHDTDDVGAADVGHHDTDAVGAADLRYYDTDGDGNADYAVRLGPAGWIDQLTYLSASGERDIVDLLAARNATDLHLILILDSVPFDVAAAYWRQGGLRLFHPPQRVISPYPVMTDPALAEFFHAGPTPAAEAAHVLDGRLRDGLGEYLRDRNSPWLPQVDYRLLPDKHAWSYLFPQAWLGHELRRIERGLERHDGRRRPGGHRDVAGGSRAAPGPRPAAEAAPPAAPAADRTTYVGYVLSTSGLGMQRGRTGHQQALARVDQFCQMLTHRFRGRLHITLLSDHGHEYGPHERIRLGRELRRAGFHDTSRPRAPEDVVVPELGLISMASIYTASPAEVARCVVGFAGVALAAYRDGETVIVLAHDGRARIVRAPGGYRYEADFGDPLRLLPIIESLHRAGRVGDGGVLPDDALFAATVNHLYPDPLDRLWHAWDGLLAHPPDVVVSLAPGWLSGSGMLLPFIDVQATHGSLCNASSTGLVMSTLGPVAGPVRMRDLRAALRALRARTAGDEARE